MVGHDDASEAVTLRRHAALGKRAWNLCLNTGKALTAATDQRSSRATCWMMNLPLFPVSPYHTLLMMRVALSRHMILRLPLLMNPMYALMMTTLLPTIWRACSPILPIGNMPLATAPLLRRHFRYAAGLLASQLLPSSEC